MKTIETLPFKQYHGILNLQHHCSVSPFDIFSDFFRDFSEKDDDMSHVLLPDTDGNNIIHLIVIGQGDESQLHISSELGYGEDGVKSTEDDRTKKLKLILDHPKCKNHIKTLSTSKNKSGYTPLDLAILNKYLHLVKLLYKKGVKHSQYLDKVNDIFSAEKMKDFSMIPNPMAPKHDL